MTGTTSRLSKCLWAKWGRRRWSSAGENMPRSPDFRGTHGHYAHEPMDGSFVWVVARDNFADQEHGLL